jgi:hypothetical protein
LSTAIIIIGLIASLITIFSFLYKHREKIVRILKQSLNMAGPLVLKIDRKLAPHKPTLNLAYTGGIELIYIGCILMAGSFFFLGFHLQLIPTAEASQASLLFLSIGLFFRYIIGNKIKKAPPDLIKRGFIYSWFETPATSWR